MTNCVRFSPIYGTDKWAKAHLFLGYDDFSVQILLFFDVKNAKKWSMGQISGLLAHF